MLIVFTAAAVALAIQGTKTSKALGPGSLAPIHLKKLGYYDIEYLTVVIHLSLSSMNIPELWKVGRLIPLLNLENPIDLAKKLRPIVLLSPTIQLFPDLLTSTLAAGVKRWLGAYLRGRGTIVEFKGTCSRRR